MYRTRSHDPEVVAKPSELIPTVLRLSRNPRSHALRGNAYGASHMRENLSRPEPVGVLGGLYVGGEYGMHSHGGPWERVQIITLSNIVNPDRILPI